MRAQWKQTHDQTTQAIVLPLLVF